MAGRLPTQILGYPPATSSRLLVAADGHLAPGKDPIFDLRLHEPESRSANQDRADRLGFPTFSNHRLDPNHIPTLRPHQHPTCTMPDTQDATREALLGSSREIPNYGVGGGIAHAACDSSHDNNAKIVHFSLCDPEDPRNWPRWKKWLMIGPILLIDLSVSWGASGFSPASKKFADDFNLPAGLGTLGLSLYVLGLAFGPMTLAPLSEVRTQTYERLRSSAPPWENDFVWEARFGEKLILLYSTTDAAQSTYIRTSSTYAFWLHRPHPPTWQCFFPCDCFLATSPR